MRLPIANTRSRCRGMSLVELMLVMAIFSVVMMAITSLFIPTQRATMVQTQVSDVQSNLRLAMNRLSQDLLTAGFLVADNPIIFEASITPTTAANPDPVDFTIRTRLVGSGFGRVISVSGNALTLSSPEMVNHFPVGAIVRLFNPVSMTEVEANTVYTVVPGVSGKITLNNVPTGTVAETIVVAVKDAAQPPLQTIRYQFADSDGNGTPDALLRIVNGTTQFLARNVSAASFAYNFTAGGKVQRVDITVAGQTRALGGEDVFSGAKTRALQSSVTLRNVF